MSNQKKTNKMFVIHIGLLIVIKILKMKKGEVILFNFNNLSLYY